MGFRGERVPRRILKRGSKKGLSRRDLDGRNMPFWRVLPPRVCGLVSLKHDSASSVV